MKFFIILSLNLFPIFKTTLFILTICKKDDVSAAFYKNEADYSHVKSFPLN